MKSLIVIYSFIKKNIIPMLFILLTTTVTLFLLVTVYGKYQYITQARDIYRDSGLEDSIYFSANFSFIESGDADSRTESREVLSEFTAFKDTLNIDYSSDGYNNAYINSFYYDDTMIESFRLKTVSGRWLSSSSSETEAVIGGTTWNGVNVGDTITLGSGLKVRVVGIMGEVALQPYFGGSSTTFTAKEMFQACGNCIFLNKSSIPQTLLDAAYLQQHFNYFVRFNESASQAEKDKVIAHLETYGQCHTYDEIMKNTNAQVKQEAKELFPLPIFLLLVSTISLISICALAIRRSMNEHSKFFLFGCSKKRSVILIASSLFVLFSIPCLINIYLVLFNPSFLRYDSVVLSEIIVDEACVLPIFLYLIAILIITTLVPIIFYKKYSPLDFYRRNL